MVVDSLTIVTLATPLQLRQPVNALGVIVIADDFDRTDPETLALFDDGAMMDLS